MGCSKSSSKREVDSNTILPQETRKALKRHPNFTPKEDGKIKTKKPQSVERKKSWRFEQKQMKKKWREQQKKLIKLKAGSLIR